MQVAVIHRISDPEGFSKAVSSASEGGLPEELEIEHQYTAEDGRTQVCIWNGPSVDAVRDVVDSGVGDFAENEVFAVEDLAES